MKPRNRRRWFGAFALIGGLLLLAYLGGGILIYNTLTPVAAQCAAASMQPNRANTPAQFQAIFAGVPTNTTPYWMPEYETVSFDARDDPAITLSGWFIPALGVADPAAQPAIIVVHGLRACKRDATALLPAGMLAHQGFNVLLIDLRNHGDSTVEDGRTSVGNREYRDVLGAWDWLRAVRGFPEARIGVVGQSLGAGTTAIAFGEELRLAAVWLDSPYADMNTVVEAELARTGYPTFLAASAPLASQLAAGLNLYAKSPLLAMDTANGRPIFITHGTADTRLSVTYSQDLIARLASHGWTAQSWFIDGLDHVQAAYALPREYQSRLVAFFRAALP